MTSYPMVDAIAGAHVRAAITVGLHADLPPDITATARDDGVVLSGARIGERWNVDPRLRAIGDAIRVAAR